MNARTHLLRAAALGLALAGSARAEINVVPFTRPELKAVITGTSLENETFQIQNRGKRVRKSYTVAAERCTTWANNAGDLARVCCSGEKVINAKVAYSRLITLHPYVVHPLCAPDAEVTLAFGCPEPPGRSDVVMVCELPPRGFFHALLHETSFVVDVDHVVTEVSEENNVDEAVYLEDGTRLD